MCACDEKFGRRFLAHQLRHGTVLQTREEVPVTLAFEPAVCRECRGLTPEAAPKSPMYGQTSKIRRYYWRELWFKTKERFADWAEAEGFSDRELATNAKAIETGKRIEAEVLKELKLAHEISPKYLYQEETQDAIIQKYGVDVVPLSAIYADHPDIKGALVIDGVDACSAEEYVARHYRRLNFETLFLESVPFHVLFGTFMWLVIQDCSDPMIRRIGFGDRAAFEAKAPMKQIWTFLPSDFGTSGYAERREQEVSGHLARIANERVDLIWNFGYWLGYSSDFRQYLWAHREEDVARARKLLDVLPAPTIKRILQYLVGSYWDRFCGWPDLLVFNDAEFFFAEVKSSKDKLSVAQKSWIKANFEELHLPFKLVKIHKSARSVNGELVESKRVLAASEEAWRCCCKRRISVRAPGDFRR
jgi:hypothetical protein